MKRSALSVRIINDVLKLVTELKAGGEATGIEAFGFAQRPAGEEVVVDAVACAAQAEDAAGKLPTGEELCAGAADATVVEAGVEGLPGLSEQGQREFQFVLEIKPRVASERAFAVEAAHGVAVADGEVVGGVELVGRALATQGGEPAQRLVGQVEGGAEA
jgi:hypothetical protein